MANSHSRRPSPVVSRDFNSVNTMTVPRTTAELVETIRKAGVRPADQLNRALAALPELPPDPQAAAAMLVENRLLTKFEAKALLSGKSRGLRLGQYAIRDVLGSGGMGVVYLAEHETMRRKVALKVLKADGAPLAVERFLREARSAASLDHPNIVRMLDVDKVSHLHYLVMEYVEGRTLHAIVSTEGRLAPAVAVEYAAQAAQGLQHAHDRGLIHRDIKPANIMVTPAGVVKVLDMGLARTDDDEDKLTERMDRKAVLGTADYIAPEQALASDTLDGRADIYSLGATLYAILAGRPPYEGTSTQKLLLSQTRDPVPLATVAPEVPAGLAAIVARMMAKDRTVRFQSMDEVLDALAPYRTGGTSVTATSETRRLPAPTPPHPRPTGSIPTPAPSAAKSSVVRPPVPAPAPSGAKSAVKAGPVTAPITPAPRRFSWFRIVFTLLALTGAVGAIWYAVDVFRNLPPEAFGPPAAATGPAAATPAPPKPAEPPKPADPPKPAPPKAEALKLPFRLDLSKMTAFRYSAEKTKSTVIEGALPAWPAGVGAFTWKEGAGAEVAGMSTDRGFAVGITNVTLDSVQLGFSLEEHMKLPLAPNKEYRVTLEYRADGEANGRLQARDPKYAGLASTELKPTNGEWRQATVIFRRPADKQASVVIDNYAAGNANTIWVRNVEVADAPPAVVFSANIKDTKPFKFRIARQKPDQDIAGLLPAGLMAQCWQPDTVGEFVRADVDGRPALGLSGLGGGESAQFFTDLQGDVNGRFFEGVDYRLEVDYRIEKGRGAYIQALDATRKTPYTLQLDPAGGKWATARMTFRRLPKGPIRVLLNTRDQADDGNRTWVSRFEILRATATAPPAPAAPAKPPMPAAKIAYKLDLAAISPFRGRVVAGKAEGDTLPPGLRAVCPGAGTVEVRRTEDGGRPVLAVANLTGPAAGRLELDLEGGLGAKLSDGRDYRAVVEYRTASGATGRLVALGDGGAEMASAELPATESGTRTAEVGFRLPETGPIRLAITNAAVGEAAAVFVSGLELREVPR